MRSFVVKLPELSCDCLSTNLLTAPVVTDRRARSQCLLTLNLSASAASAPAQRTPNIMTSAGPVASPGFGVTVRKALDHLTLSDFTVFDWTQSSPADSERTTAVCTLIGSGIAEVDNGVVQLKETATISSCHTAFGKSPDLLQICFRKDCSLCDDAIFMPFTASQEALQNHSGTH